jgi:hypothetical protein
LAPGDFRTLRILAFDVRDVVRAYRLLLDPAVPAGNLKEFVAFTRARPGQLLFASSGTGTTLHLAGVLFDHDVRANRELSRDQMCQYVIGQSYVTASPLQVLRAVNRARRAMGYELVPLEALRFRRADFLARELPPRLAAAHRPPRRLLVRQSLPREDHDLAPRAELRDHQAQGE